MIRLYFTLLGSISSLEFIALNLLIVFNVFFLRYYCWSYILGDYTDRCISVEVNILWSMLLLMGIIKLWSVLKSCCVISSCMISMLGLLASDATCNGLDPPLLFTLASMKFRGGLLSLTILSLPSLTSCRWSSNSQLISGLIGCLVYSYSFGSWFYTEI